MSDVEYGTDLPVFNWTRLNEGYQQAVGLARIILKATTPELGSGDKRSSAFLVDMNEVFERFVWTALRESLGLPRSVFPLESRGRPLFLDQRKRIKLEPDLSWWRDGRCIFVGDAKYKRVAASGVKHPDLYQMLAYTTATGLPRGLIIYAQGETEPTTHVVHLAGKSIEVRILDLDGSPQECLDRVALLANSIRLSARASAVDVA